MSRNQRAEHQAMDLDGCLPRRDSELPSVYRFVYLLPTWCYFLWNAKIPVSRCPRSRGSFTKHY